MGELRALTEQRYEKKYISLGELNAVKIKQKNAQLGLVDSEAAYRKAKLDLGSFMNLTHEEIAALELRGTIDDLAPPPPPVELLQKLAVEERPDVVSLRLGIQRAEADVRLARANAYSDVYVLWQPYTFQDNSPYGLKSQYSWALGVTVPLPIYNRNQGGIQRAKLNVTQSQIQLSDLERQAKIDVAQAMLEYRGHACRRSRISASRLFPMRSKCATKRMRSGKREKRACPTTSTLSSATTRSSSSISTRRSVIGGACSRSILSWAGGSCHERFGAGETGNWRKRRAFLESEGSGHEARRRIGPDAVGAACGR